MDDNWVGTGQDYDDDRQYRNTCNCRSKVQNGRSMKTKNVEKNVAAQYYYLFCVLLHHSHSEGWTKLQTAALFALRKCTASRVCTLST